MISEDIKLDYDDVLIVPGKSPIASRKQVELNVGIDFPARRAGFSGIPIMAANMDGVGTVEMADALRRHGIFTCLTKFHAPEQLAEYFSADPERRAFAAVTIGIGDEDWEKFTRTAELTGAHLTYVCLDVANGYTDRFVDCVRRFRDTFPDKVLIAGNVVTPEQTGGLIAAGADLVKVGIGGGSVCETRVKTGVGYPQFSTVIECAHAAREAGGRIIADGGCTTPGDVAKALAAGADFVMLGGYVRRAPGRGRQDC